jgi:phosphatidate cytidylyltransferase
MELWQALGTWYFWAYAGSALLLLLAAAGGLFRMHRRGQRLDDLGRVYWSWLLVFGGAVLAILLGHEFFVLIVALVSLFACYEYARATGLYRDWIFTGLVYLAILAVNGVALWAGLHFAESRRGYDFFMATPIYAVAVLCLLPVLRNRAEGMLPLVALAVMAFVYFGYFLAHLSLLAGGRPPVVYGYLFYMLFGTWTAAVAGWAVGRRFGGHALAPRISTEITWENTFACLAWAFVWSFGLGWTLPINWVAWLLSAILFGLLGPLGDLAMRYMLRDLGLKTADEALPVVPSLTLDHLYRLLFVAPLFFRLVHLFQPDILLGSR